MLTYKAGKKYIINGKKCKYNGIVDENRIRNKNIKVSQLSHEFIEPLWISGRKRAIYDMELCNTIYVKI